MPQYDVFLSYSRVDAAAVQLLAEELRRRQLRVFFDQSELPPGDPWQPLVEQALQDAGAIVVAVGSSGVGTWEAKEVDAALRRQAVEKDVRVIPVILPRATKPNERDLPVFLAGNTWVAFEQSVSEELPLRTLYWGITGRRWEERARAAVAVVAPAAAEASVEHAIAQLRGRLAAERVTFFVGAGMSPASKDLPPRSHELADQLLEYLEYPCDEDDPPFPRDIAGDYYAVKLGGESLVEDSIVELVQRRTRCAPLAHRYLAELMGCLPRSIRRGRATPQLIVTSNIDLLMERALLRAGVPFTRLVSMPAGNVVHINEYENVKREGDGNISVADGTEWRAIRPDDYEGLDEFIGEHRHRVYDPNASDATGATGNFTLDQLPQPLLYKCHGSLDVADSCAISADRSMQIAVSRGGALPGIKAAIQNTHWLFLGYCLFDPELRLLYYTILRDALQVAAGLSRRRYAVHVHPTSEAHDKSRRLEAKLWNSVKDEWASRLSTTVIEEPCDAFLERLLKQLQQH
jgi:hypothetical protein